MLLMDSQTLTMSPQGQITIPKAWRELLGFKPGEKVLAMMDMSRLGKTLKLWVKPKSWVEKVSGSALGAWGKNKKEIDENIQKIREEWDR